MGKGKGLVTKPEDMLPLLKKLSVDNDFNRELVAEQSLNARRFTSSAVERLLLDALEAILPRQQYYKTVSIVICTFNRRDYVERVLDYLRYQTSSDFEVIVVDGPSTDGTKELLAKCDDLIKTAHNPERNLSVSRNLGIELAAGDIVAFVDDDAIPFDDWVASVIAAYNSHPLTVVGMGGPTYYAGTLRFQVRDIGFNKMADSIPNIERHRVGKHGWFRTLLGTNSTFTRQALLDCCGFDEEYDYFLDESDLCWRLQVRKGLIGFSDSIYLRHEFAESANRRSKHNYNWFSICKNTAYFVSAYGDMDSDSCASYLKERLQRERIDPLASAVREGELSQTDYEKNVRMIWQGFEQGLADSKHFPRTRPLRITPRPFHRYPPRLHRQPSIDDRGRLHVCIVSKEFPPFAARGGIGTLYYHLASELLLMGNRVTVIVPSEEKREYVQGNFRIVYAPKRAVAIPDLDPGFANNVSWSVSALEALQEISAVDRVDVIDAALWDTEALAIALLPKHDRPPVVLRLVTPFPVAANLNHWQVPPQVSAFFTEAERTLINHSDALIPISDSIATTIQTEYQVAIDGRWIKVPCGISYWPSFDVNLGYTAFQEFENVPADVLRAEKLIVFLGRLEQRKGIDILLSSANDILSADPDAVLLIAGRDVEGWAPRLSEFIAETNSQRVHLLGEIADPTREKLLAKAYCVVFPSRYESFGLVPLEAFVHGVPVIASRSGAIPEVILDGVCGILFETESARSLSTAVISLLMSKELRARLALGARERVRTLSSRNMAAGTMRAYRSVLK